MFPLCWPYVAKTQPGCVSRLNRERWGMAEVRTVTTLIAKRDEIERSIAGYKSRLAQARADLSHVNACIDDLNDSLRLQVEILPRSRLDPADDIPDQPTRAIPHNAHPHRVID